LPVEGFQIIDEIVLGPKNTTPRLVVEAMCRKAGIPRVTIRKSGISMQ
jgi:hypothetical protein